MVIKAPQAGSKEISSPSIMILLDLFLIPSVTALN